ncbi:superoxide dismutase [Lachnospiraceae bacterium 47-T17]
MNEHYKFINHPLPYAYDAMEPYIDEKTMHLHHDRHLQTYIDNLNNTLSDYPEFQGWTLEQLIVNVPSLPPDIRTSVKNNGGGVYNHQFYFSGLKNPSSSQPVGTLKQAMEKELGGFEAWKEAFKKSALSVFGSGYAWLVVKATGALGILTTKNQNTPFPLGMFPVLNIDVWEHAYYLKHYNERGAYIDDWFQVINWEQADKNYLNCFRREL